MSLSALDSVGDAIEATKRFLTPFDRARWFRLAVVMFFVGGAGLSLPQVPPGGFGDGTGGPSTDPGAGGGVDPGTVTPELTTALLVFLVVFALLVVTIALLWQVAGATMEFVFVESLGREEVKLRTYFLDHWRRGVRLFVFRVGVQFLTVATVGGVVLALAVALGGWPPTGWGAGTAITLALVGIPVVLVAVFVLGNVLGFTTVFVVPVMLREERGVIGAWRRFWPTLVGNWKEYLAYVFVAFLLGIGVGFATGFLTLLAALVFGIPFAVVAIPVALVFGLGSLGGLVALVLGLAFVVLVFVATLLIGVPFGTFQRYYALFVLGDTNPEFDVIPDARAAVRTDGGTGADDPPDDGTAHPDGSDDSGGPGGSDAGSAAGPEGIGSDDDPWADRGDSADDRDDTPGEDGDDWNVDGDDRF